VFFHALPSTFWDEILGAIPLMGVIDMCPGDGSLALAAFKRGICYTGLCMSDMHKNQLNAYLEQRIVHTMSDPNSLIYEPRLVASLQTTPTPKAAATPAAKKKATPKPKEEGEPQKKNHALRLRTSKTNAAMRTMTSCLVMRSSMIIMVCQSCQWEHMTD